ncbi:RTA1 like protein [Dacryopinax primogenitus]|uniref:RTA1 like protein n=1 Tax=Dacryopinax primogenitus (strain DJM 731) TaxID=1858805 RepID=M5FS16_DACPD|nr:RTA1 like protein [Dacryopinax primogenitus]EJT97904.1 RTA1 like protein [Dacryopinax primogenitus]
MSSNLSFSPYGYTPTLYVCAIYVALFSLSTFLHFFQSLRSRLWWLLPTLVAGGTAEIIGWSGRLWSAKEPNNLNPYLMQITTTIMAPSFMTAANFLILGIIISRLGVQYSRLSPRAYSIVFITADLVALIVQAIGGGMASVAVQNETKGKSGNPENGAHIMVGGIIWQMAAMTIYVVLALEFFIRVRLDKPVRQLPDVLGSSRTDESSSVEGEKRKSRWGIKVHVHPHVEADTALAAKVRTHGFGFAEGSKLSLVMTALFLSTLLIYMRSIYRTIELLDGWTGRIITTELYFNVLDAMPITLAMFTMNLLHPGWLLYGKDTGKHPQGGFEMMETDVQAEREHEEV